MSSLKDDIAALSQAQKIARETTMKLEEQVNRERAEKEVLINKIKVYIDLQLCFHLRSP